MKSINNAMFSIVTIAILLICLPNKHEAYKIVTEKDGKFVVISEEGDQVEDPVEYVVNSPDETIALNNVMAIVRGFFGNDPLFGFFPRMDDVFLFRIIRCKKYNTLLSLQAIVDYYNSVKTLSEEEESKFIGMVPETYRAAIEANLVRVLKEKFNSTPVIVVQLSKLGGAGITKENFQMALLFFFEELFRDPDTQAHGVTVILDLEKTDYMGLIGDRKRLGRLFSVVFKMFPLRLDQAHIINGGLKASAGLLGLKWFMPGGTKDRIHNRSKRELMSILNKEKNILSAEFEKTGNWDEKDFNTTMMENILSNNSRYDDNWKPTVSDAAVSQTVY